MAPGRDHADRHHRHGPPANSRGHPAEHPVERPGPPGTSGARPGGRGAPVRASGSPSTPGRWPGPWSDGSGNARPMPTLSAMLAKTASATDAYTAWVASAGHTSRPPASGRGGSRRRRHPRQRARPGTRTMGQRPRSMAHLRDDAGDEPADPGRGRPPARPSRTRACLTANTSRQCTMREESATAATVQRDVPVALPQM